MKKPKGITSFDVIFRLRKILKIKKIGHCGTLDPMAQGVLPVFFGKATKAIQYLKDTDKEYLARFKFGLKTDTQDIEGKVLKEEKANVKKQDLEDVLKKFIGRVDQVPPMYSACKVNGQPLYKLARKGEVVERKKRSIKIYSLQCFEFDEKKQEGVVKIFCSSGTYVRTLIEDLAAFLNTIGVLLELLRTRACGFFLKDCYTIEEIGDAIKSGRLNFLVLPVEVVFSSLKKIYLNEEQQLKFLNGAAIEFKDLGQGEMFRVFGSEFLGVAKALDCKLVVEKIFKEKEF